MRRTRRSATAPQHDPGSRGGLLSLNVLVTDGEQRAALALVRSLGRAGHAVRVASTCGGSIGAASRFSRAEHVLPDPLAQPSEFAAALLDVARRTKCNVLLPVTEAALLAVLPKRDQFADITIPFVDIERFRAVCDKRLVLRRAEELGIHVPRQVVLDSPHSAVPMDLEYPLVVKPSRSVGDDQDGTRTKLGVQYASSHDHLLDVLKGVSAAAFPVLLQRRIVGPGEGVFLLLWNGEVLATFSHRRIREKPPSGGVSVYSESIPTDPALVAASRRLLESFRWNGVAMVEFKRDQVSRDPYLMEINGRFWGSLQLAVDAGVDFPALLVSAAAGRAISSPTPYRVGVRSRWWWGDFDSLLGVLRSNPADDAAPRKLRAIADFLVFWQPGDRSEILRLDDPRPFLRETASWLKAIAR